MDKLKNADTVGAVVMAGSFGALWDTVAVVVYVFAVWVLKNLYNRLYCCCRCGGGLL